MPVVKCGRRLSIASLLQCLPVAYQLAYKWTWTYETHFRLSLKPSSHGYHWFDVSCPMFNLICPADIVSWWFCLDSCLVVPQGWSPLLYTWKPTLKPRARHCPFALPIDVHTWPPARILGPISHAVKGWPKLGGWSWCLEAKQKSLASQYVCIEWQQNTKRRPRLLTKLFISSFLHYCCHQFAIVQKLFVS